MAKVSKPIALGAALCLMLFAAGAYSSDEKQEKAAVAAAEKWLALVDEGKYAEGWEETPASYKARVDKKSWVQSLQSDRGCEGACRARKFVSSAYWKAAHPQSRDHVSIRFNTSFQNRKYALERLTLVLDKDGHWRVIEYIITAALPDLKSTAAALLLLFVIAAIWKSELRNEGELFTGRKRRF